MCSAVHHAGTGELGCEQPSIPASDQGRASRGTEHETDRITDQNIN